jgi:hypothetical protein
MFIEKIIFFSKNGFVAFFSLGTQKDQKASKVT